METEGLDHSLSLEILVLVGMQPSCMVCHDSCPSGFGRQIEIPGSPAEEAEEGEIVGRTQHHWNIPWTGDVDVALCVFDSGRPCRHRPP